MNPIVKRCLLVEDDPDDRELFIQALLSVSPTVDCYTVANGEEALLTLVMGKFIPDFIFTDIQMPRIDGVEFIVRLKKLQPFKDIPVIVYASNTSAETVEKIKTLGVKALYAKTRLDVLYEILKKYFYTSSDFQN
jgi:CheY-like chemotaxis protein